MTESAALELHIAKLQLAPGDVLVVKVDQPLPDYVTARVRRHVEDLVPGHRCLVLDGGATLDVLTAADLAARLDHDPTTQRGPGHG